MKNIVLAFILSVCATFVSAQIVTVPIPGAPGLNVTVGVGANALPLQDIRNNPNAVNISTSDDWYTNVPLGFNFPFYGQTFNNSWAATNGFVTFQDPQVSGLWGGCCSGVDLTRTTDPRYNYTIYGLHTDLYSWNGANQYYLRGTNEMTYGWYNISQCCGSQGGNSFEIKINSSGLIDTRIAGALVSWNAVTSGFAGDLSKGEYYQHYHGQGINITPGSSSIFSWQALNGTGGGVDQCTINPLYNPSCPGYAAAYMSQQCTISALYNPSCPGYAQAYFDQQCSLNSLYNENCPGYAQAYLTYQCSVNPLYSTTCEGYAQAYFDQQCSLNGLYSTSCPNYAQAYATQQALRQSQPSTSTNTTTSTATAVTTTPTVSSTGETKIAVVSDPIVNNVVTTTATSASPAQAATATVPLVQSNTTTTETKVVTAAVVREEKKEEKKDATSSSSNTSSTSTTAQTTDEKKSDQPKTARQELQERRVAAARAAAVEAGKNLAGNIGKAASMEQQIAVQNVVIAAMGYTPGFDAYGKVFVPDSIGYKPFTIYNNQKNIDNPAGRRFMTGSDRLHEEMVNEQYRK